MNNNFRYFIFSFTASIGTWGYTVDPFAFLITMGMLYCIGVLVSELK